MKRCCYGLLYGMLSLYTIQPIHSSNDYGTVLLCLQVTAAEREHMKRCSYGLLYGMGNSRLAKQLGLEHGQAVKMAAEFKQGLQGVAGYFEVRCVRKLHTRYRLHVRCLQIAVLPVANCFAGVGLEHGQALKLAGECKQGPQGVAGCFEVRTTGCAASKQHARWHHCECRRMKAQTQGLAGYGEVRWEGLALVTL
jgi:hypothetical protein